MVVRPVAGRPRRGLVGLLPAERSRRSRTASRPRSRRRLRPATRKSRRPTTRRTPTPRLPLPGRRRRGAAGQVLPPADIKGPLDEPNAGAAPRRRRAPRRPAPALPLPPTSPPPPPAPGEHARKTPGAASGDRRDARHWAAAIPCRRSRARSYAGDRDAPAVGGRRTSRRRCRSWPTAHAGSRVAGRPDRRCVRRGGAGGGDAAAHETGPVCPNDAAGPLRQPPAAHPAGAGRGRPAANRDGASAEAVDEMASGRRDPADGRPSAGSRRPLAILFVTYPC